MLGAGMVPAATSGMAVRGALSGGESGGGSFGERDCDDDGCGEGESDGGGFSGGAYAGDWGDFAGCEKTAVPVNVQAAIPAPVAVVPVVAATLPAVPLDDATDSITVRGTVFGPNGKGWQRRGSRCRGR